MADRELLELAAKAAGLALVLWHENGTPHAVRHPHDTASFPWNPLTDDGDALRLAVKLRMIVQCSGVTTHVHIRGLGLGSDIDFNVSDCAAGLDVNAATRRAIVRAAAQIGQGASHG